MKHLLLLIKTIWPGKVGISVNPFRLLAEEDSTQPDVDGYLVVNHDNQSYCGACCEQ